MKMDWSPNLHIMKDEHEKTLAIFRSMISFQVTQFLTIFNFQTCTNTYHPWTRGWVRREWIFPSNEMKFNTISVSFFARKVFTESLLQVLRFPHLFFHGKISNVTLCRKIVAKTDSGKCLRRVAFLGYLVDTKERTRRICRNFYVMTGTKRFPPFSCRVWTKNVSPTPGLSLISQRPNMNFHLLQQSSPRQFKLPAVIIKLAKKRQGKAKSPNSECMSKHDVDDCATAKRPKVSAMILSLARVAAEGPRCVGAQVSPDMHSL